MIILYNKNTNSKKVVGGFRKCNMRSFFDSQCRLIHRLYINYYMLIRSDILVHVIQF